MIPKMMHRIWIGDPMPAAYQDYWQKWKDMHDGWEFLTWGENDLHWLRNRDLFDAAPTIAEKADIARYELLYNFGGVYLDVDFEPLRSISELVSDVPAFSAYEDSQHVAIGIMGSVPGHAFYRALIDRMAYNIVRYESHATNRRTGPLYFTEVVREFPDVHLFTPEFFYPYHYTEEDPGTYPDTAYAVHHWTGSWI